MDLERRPYGWERRASLGGTPSHPLIRGTAIVFDQRSTDLGGFVEIIRPDAITRTLREGIDVRAFFDHDPAKVLGRKSAGTLTLEADRRGLHVAIDPPVPTEPANLLQSIQRGDITGMSFAFRVMPGGEEFIQSGEHWVRYINDMQVFEVSVVSMPAYSQTDVAVAQRALQAFLRPWPTIAERRAQMQARAAGWR